MIFSVLSQRIDIHTKNEEKLRCFIEAVYYIMRSGCQWRLLPFYYGSWRAVHKRFAQWRTKGIWHSLFESIKNNADMESVMIDATIIRAHPCAAGYGRNTQDEQALGRSKGGFTSKIHALVDGLGNPLKFILTPGQRNDITQATGLIDGITEAYVLADKGYDSDTFIKQLHQQHCSPVIPPRAKRKNPRTYDAHIYKERHLIECFFGKIKHFRRIFSRFDKMADSYLAFLQFAATCIWLK